MKKACPARRKFRRTQSAAGGEVFLGIKDVRCGAEYEVNAGEDADYTCAVTYRAQSQDTVQIPVVIFVNASGMCVCCAARRAHRKTDFCKFRLLRGKIKFASTI